MRVKVIIFTIITTIFDTPRFREMLGGPAFSILAFLTVPHFLLPSRTFNLHIAARE